MILVEYLHPSIPGKLLVYTLLESLLVVPSLPVPTYYLTLHQSSLRVHLYHPTSRESVVGCSTSVVSHHW